MITEKEHNRQLYGHSLDRMQRQSPVASRSSHRPQLMEAGAHLPFRLSWAGSAYLRQSPKI